MSTESTVELKEPTSTAMTAQEVLSEALSEAPQISTVGSASSESETTLLESEIILPESALPESEIVFPKSEAASPEPDTRTASSQKAGNAFVVLALFVAIVGVVAAAFYSNRDDPPATEVPQIAPLIPEMASPEAEVTPPASETVLLRASKEAKKSEAAKESEKPQSGSKKLTRAEIDRLNPLIIDALSDHETARGYYRSGDYENALTYYQKALDSYEHLQAYYEPPFGDDNNNMATIQKNIAVIYNSIGEVHRSKDNYAEALDWLNKSMTIREKIQGDSHPDTAKTYNNIALVHDSKGEYAEAVKWYRKSLTIYEKTLGSEHPDTGKVYNRLGVAYLRQDSYADAMSLFKKAAAIQEKEQLNKDRHAASTFNNMAEIHRAQGDYVFALPEYLKAYRILLDTHGEEHSTTQGVRRNMTRAYEKSGNGAPFEEWLEVSLR
jgi:tetratricopeptide (TPR) repeat protein